MRGFGVGVNLYLAKCDTVSPYRLRLLLACDRCGFRQRLLRLLSIISLYINKNMVVIHQSVLLNKKPQILNGLTITRQKAVLI